MSEQEKYEQVGRLAEEYSRLKGESNQISEKLIRAREAFAAVSAAMAQNLVVLGPNDELVMLQQQRYAQPQNPGELAALLNHHELQEAYKAQKKLIAELAEVTGRLRSLAPHLV